MDDKSISIPNYAFYRLTLFTFVIKKTGDIE